MALRSMYILGCSQASGFELQEFGKYLNTPYELQHSFAAQFGQALGYETINLARSGGSNDFIFRMFLEIIPKLRENDVIFVSWTSPDRVEVFDIIEEKWMDFGPGFNTFNGEESYGKKSRYLDFHRKYVEFLASHNTLGNNNRLKNVIALNSIAQTLKIRVINHSSSSERRNDMPLTECVYAPSIIWLNKDSSFYDWAIKEKQPRSEFHHFSEPTHTAYCSILLQEFKEKYEDK